MRQGQDVRSDLRAALNREWLLGNGLGGFAAGTAAGANTRSAHAYLVAAAPHGCLTALLLKLDERLSGPDGNFEMSTHVHADGVVRPAGHRMIEAFTLDPWPKWRYRAGSVVLEKSLFAVAGHNAVVIIYRHVYGPATTITASPLLVARGLDAVQREVIDAQSTVQGIPGRMHFEVYPGGC